MIIRKLTILSAIFTLCSFMLISHPFESEVNAGSDSPPNVLVIHPGPPNEMSENLQSLDMVISHFTTNLAFKSTNELSEKDVRNVTHLIYFGEAEEDLPEKSTKLINGFEGEKIVFGKNHEQLTGFEFVKINGLATVQELLLPSNDKAISLPIAHQIVDVKGSETTKEWIASTGAENRYPLFIQDQKHYYYADHELAIHDSILLGEVLHDILQIEHKESHPAAIRLEDVNPLTDVDLLEQCMDLLITREIPFMVSVTPVYFNPATGEEYKLSDSPALVELLQKIQLKGGSLVLHGYTDQSGKGKSGDGFEFLDTAIPSFLLKDSDQYINQRISQGIEELHENGLEPKAFEAPHYTMSHSGYKEVSKHFSTYVGQLQLSDQNWEVMKEAPFLTKPSFINGMELIPETLRYIEEGNESSIDQIMERAENLMLNRDSVMSVFYHPYLGPEGLEKLLDQLLSISDLEWVDLNDQGKQSYPALNDNHEKMLRVEPKTASLQIIKPSNLLTLNFQSTSLIIGGLLAVLMIVFSYLITLRNRHEER
ncbi:DUF2334 domain-containing protein [Halobacillus litoralis]|nr:DUF2334 domain-containing protein [Halobacillus litoralis]